jgi:hypothetical protein
MAAGLAVLASTLLACSSTAPTSPPPSIVTQPTAPSTSIPTPRGSPTPVPEASGVFRVILLMPDGTSPLPVVLQDLTGLVAGVAARQPGVPPFDEGVTNPAGQAGVLRYGWVGGACDTLTTITLERGDQGFRLSATTTRRGDICAAIGLFRSIDIQLTAEVDATSVLVIAR